MKKIDIIFERLVTYLMILLSIFGIILFFFISYTCLDGVLNV